MFEPWELLRKRKYTEWFEKKENDIEKTRGTVKISH